MKKKRERMTIFLLYFLSYPKGNEYLTSVFQIFTSKVRKDLHDNFQIRPVLLPWVEGYVTESELELLAA